MTEKHFEPGKWKVSPLNFMDEATSHMRLPEKVTIKDTTLRDGAQMVGIAFTPKEHVLYAKKADELGVAFIEIVPGREPEAFQGVRDLDLKNAKLVSLASAFKRASAYGRRHGKWVTAGMGFSQPKIELIEKEKDWKENLDVVMDADLDWISLLNHHPDTVSLPNFRKMSDDEWIERIIAAIEYIKERGFPCKASVSRTTWTKLSSLERFYKAAVEAGADHVGAADGTGIGSPAGIGYLVRLIKKWVGKTPLNIHLHNDLGCAMANVLAAVEAGADVIDATTNGLGDHGGLPSIAEVATALRCHYGIDTGIKLEKLREISRFVEDVTRFPLALNAPLVGRRTFYDSHYVMHLEGWKVGDPFRFNAIVPEVLGMKRHILPARQTSPMAIQHKMEELGIEVPEDKLPEIYDMVHEEALIRKKVLEDDDMREIAKAILG